MGKLSYGMMMSLDGFVADASSYFDAGVLSFINDEMRKLGTEIYGRRMYEEMLYWETYQPKKLGSEHADEFARIWKGLDKLVISSTLERPSSNSTQLVREFLSEDIRQLKAASNKGHLSLGSHAGGSFRQGGIGR